MKSASETRSHARQAPQSALNAQMGCSPRELGRPSAKLAGLGGTHMADSVWLAPGAHSVSNSARSVLKVAKLVGLANLKMALVLPGVHSVPLGSTNPQEQ